MFTATLPGGSGWRVWTISYNMQQLVLSCVCVTLVLHCIGVVAAGRLRAGGPTPLQLGLYYYSSGFVLIIYAAGVALIVRARPAEPADDLPLQQSRASTSDRCNALLNGVILVAACGGPPAFLVFLMRPVPALVVLVCLAVAGGLSAAVWWCWLCLAAGPAADREPRQQFVSLVEGVNLRSQVIARSGVAAIPVVRSVHCICSQVHRGMNALSAPWPANMPSRLAGINVSASRVTRTISFLTRPRCAAAGYGGRRRQAATAVPVRSTPITVT